MDLITRITLVGLVAGQLAIAASLHAEDLYGFDIPKQYPKAYTAYTAVLPAQYKKISCGAEARRNQRAGKNGRLRRRALPPFLDV